ncbi:tetratricopeptide repeat protein [Curtobacterium sp. MCLR17_042]|uniref:tetratricopeptide repeat protein n=1 Tax=Curtobacterium sp. MCLR17_042 TaxID=2175626 RepID=UPI0015E8D1C9|nr:tetratricopeptide repeat protein [Curtobacterium sp. MCLR17_042]
MRRGLRLVARSIADGLPAGTTIRLSGWPSEIDAEFLDLLVANRLVEAHVARFRGEAQPDDEQRFVDSLILAASSGDANLRDGLNRLLNCGDSWNAERIASIYLDTAQSVDPLLGDVLGLAFALQGETGTAQLLWSGWSEQSPLAEARARYSLSMLAARHHPQALRDHGLAKRHLEQAWERLKLEPESEQVLYERVFNRNGLALLLFREGRLQDAAVMLERGIKFIEVSRFGQKVHHTVLLSNLGRVYAAAGEDGDAERCLRRAVELDPKFAEYWQDLAGFLADHGNLHEAIQTASQAVLLDPSIPEAHRLLGYLHMLAEDAHAARDAYEVAARLGDATALLDMLRASNAARTYSWTLAQRPWVDGEPQLLNGRAETELLYIEAEIQLDPLFDGRRALSELKTRYPDDELVDQNWSANASS